MLNIYDFFSPLNIVNISVLVLSIIYCDIVGYWISRFFIGELKPFLRGSVWLLGLGLVVFIYFLSHYFVSYSSPLILLLLLILVILPMKFFFKEKAYLSLFLFLKSNIYPIIIVVLILPIIFIKASQPPYVWDEMAYHFISPYMVNYEKVWNTGTSFYMNLPRLMDTAYISLFSLTNTYSVSRLLSFSVFTTFLLMGYSFLKQKFGFGLAIVFFVLTYFYPENYLLWSTFGYIDIGTTSFVMIGFFLLLDYLYDKTFSSLQYALAFFGMALGSKYSAVTQFLAFIIISVVLMFIRKDFSAAKNKKILIGFTLFLFLGGYWYVKNFILTGNPIYPILFGCKFSVCENIDFSYTFPFTISSLPIISSRIFLNNLFLPVLSVTSIVVSLTLGSDKIKKMVLTILCFTAIEILLLKNISGFEGRYFYHWQVFAVLIIVAPLFVLNKVKILQFIKEKIKKKKH